MDEQKAAKMNGATVNEASREKYWKEISIEEKLERLRYLVKSFAITAENNRSELYELRDFIWNHSHEENGEVVVKVSKQESHRLFNRRGLGSVTETLNNKSDEAYI